MGGGRLSTSQAPRHRRQSAIRLFAREYYESSLSDGGAAEFDPVFIVTKLGAKVNRMFVAGVVESLERRETEAGTMYSGSVRDPTGRHMWSVGSFQPELHGEMEELVSRFDSGDRFLMAIIGKSNSYTTEDGGFFVRIRLEDYAIIDRNTYAGWLAETAGHTMRRIDAWQKAQGAEAMTRPALEAADVPRDCIDGLMLAAGHYEGFDPEAYKVGVLQALAAAEGRAPDPEVTAAASESTAEAAPAAADATPAADEPAKTDIDVKALIMSIVAANEAPEGVPYDVIQREVKAKGVTDEVEVEDALENLSDEGELMEPRFGWFKAV